MDKTLLNLLDTLIPIHPDIPIDGFITHVQDQTMKKCLNWGYPFTSFFWYGKVI
ncbi:hypothetical protein [Desulfobacula sp.]|uniref:hypothetical protein n=1 Tax=Desulfobacula sp. TaxID=2593537 RepID=UPI0025B84A59|nr:hypothetical protein [Desulfobacula sp.]MBC2704628.1 hypothetical protein [Desulfobacula sp.]